MKNLKMLWLACGLLSGAVIILSVLLVKEQKSGESLRVFSAGMVVSFSNAVDYSLCSLDKQLGNAYERECKPYFDRFVNDIKILGKTFDMEGKYVSKTK